MYDPKGSDKDFLRKLLKNIKIINTFLQIIVNYQNHNSGIIHYENVNYTVECFVKKI